ncbi:MAG: hypothetical protein A2X88_09565 [Deltaproteobacteria bacterium GWC2_65_14]|nr:MAG: hypothetical protein A2X88_09565 [Deltaproteobacteria bacterium GWC2_65_14]
MGDPPRERPDRLHLLRLVQLLQEDAVGLLLFAEFLRYPGDPLLRPRQLRERLLQFRPEIFRRLRLSARSGRSIQGNFLRVRSPKGKLYYGRDELREENGKERTKPLPAISWSGRTR